MIACIAAMVITAWGWSGVTRFLQKKAEEAEEEF